MDQSQGYLSELPSEQSEFRFEIEFQDFGAFAFGEINGDPVQFGHHNTTPLDGAQSYDTAGQNQLTQSGYFVEGLAPFRQLRERCDNIHSVNGLFQYLLTYVQERYSEAKPEGGLDAVLRAFEDDTDRRLVETSELVKLRETIEIVKDILTTVEPTQQRQVPDITIDGWSILRKDSQKEEIERQMNHPIFNFPAGSNWSFEDHRHLYTQYTTAPPPKQSKCRSKGISRKDSHLISGHKWIPPTACTTYRRDLARKLVDAMKDQEGMIDLPGSRPYVKWLSLLDTDFAYTAWKLINKLHKVHLYYGVVEGLNFFQREQLLLKTFRTAKGNVNSAFGPYLQREYTVLWPGQKHSTYKYNQRSNRKKAEDDKRRRDEEGSRLRLDFLRLIRTPADQSFALDINQQPAVVSGAGKYLSQLKNQEEILRYPIDRLPFPVRDTSMNDIMPPRQFTASSQFYLPRADHSPLSEQRTYLNPDPPDFNFTQHAPVTPICPPQNLTAATAKFPQNAMNASSEGLLTRRSRKRTFEASGIAGSDNPSPKRHNSSVCPSYTDFLSSSPMANHPNYASVLSKHHLQTKRQVMPPHNSILQKYSSSPPDIHSTMQECFDRGFDQTKSHLPSPASTSSKGNSTGYNAVQHGLNSPFQQDSSPFQRPASPRQISNVRELEVSKFFDPTEFVQFPDEGTEGQLEVDGSGGEHEDADGEDAEGLAEYDAP